MSAGSNSLIPSKFSFDDVPSIKNSLESISQEIIQSSDIDEINKLEKLKNVLL
jgi:hypothetical protein